jgi:hypothetical protein
LVPNPATRGHDEYGRYRYIGDYHVILNCPDDAFSNALKTLKARSDQFGATSAEVRDWLQAQILVFKNCPTDQQLVLPEPASATASALVRADRAYQTAAAYFYGMKFEEAERRFGAIGADRASPWRNYGRYLAARSVIRRATVDEKDPAQAERLLLSAEAELRAVLDDPEATIVHHGAQGLLNHLGTRLHPIDRLHAVSKVVAGSASPAAQDIIDYRWLMDRLVGDTVDYDYSAIRSRDEIVADELNDWILATQGRGEAALVRALSQWQAKQSPLWLVPVMWKIPSDHPQVVNVLKAASEVEAKSPTFPTIAFLRVRLLIRMGRLDDARAILATLPEKPQPGYQLETLNLLKGERLMLARSFDEFLANAPRAIVTNWTINLRTPQGIRAEQKGYDAPTFDEDASAIFSDRLPLSRLLEASTSTVLAPRLRLRVAVAGFARAVVLRRDDVGIPLAKSLQDLAPSLRGDLDRYVAAPTDEDRHLAAILLLLRTPGIRAFVSGLDTEEFYKVTEPARSFDHLSGTNWWCGFDQRADPAKAGSADSELIELLYLNHRVPYPAFLTANERATTERELRELAAAGPARNYITAEAIKWARSRTTDPDAAEALAKAVQGWRWTCGDNASPDLPQRAFQTLHRLFPKSDWAKQTKYWYR